MLLMTLVIFLPSVFALGLCFPKERGRCGWFALLGSAVTLVVSLWMLVDYYNLLNSDTSIHRVWRCMAIRPLDYRVAGANKRAGESAFSGLRRHKPWIKKFSIEYFHLDDISLPLLVLTLLNFLAIIAGWKIGAHTRAVDALPASKTGMVTRF